MIEEEEEGGSDYDSFDEGDFEMIPNRRAGGGASSVSGSSRAQSRRPEVRKVRVKVHADDVRYIMVGTAVEFPDFIERIREKFGISRRFKVKIRDEDAPEDMITMGDQDDLDMAMASAKQAARRARQDIGKLEVRLPKPLSSNHITLTLAPFPPPLSLVPLCQTRYFQSDYKTNHSQNL